MQKTRIASITVALALIAGAGAYATRAASPVAGFEPEALMALQQQQAPPASGSDVPVPVFPRLFSHADNAHGFRLTVDETSSHYIVQFSPHVPTGNAAGHLVDPRPIAYAELTQTVLGVSTSHPMVQVGPRFIATIRKSSVLPFFDHTFKAVGWDQNANWNNERDAIFWRKSTFNYF